jgi:hypothetical protein
MNIFCYADGDDYLCEYGAGTYRLGEVHGTRLIAFDQLYDIQEQYPDADITKEVLDAAIKFAVREGYIAESYATE